jgi:hypothetical protein
VWAAPRVVGVQSFRYIGRQTDIEVRSLIGVSQYVHESFAARHRSGRWQPECRSSNSKIDKNFSSGDCERAKWCERTERWGSRFCPPPRHGAKATLRRGILRVSETCRFTEPKLAEGERLVHRAEARRRRAKDGGPDRDRTGDLMNAIHARSQLRYWPILGRVARTERTPIVTRRGYAVKPDDTRRRTARNA